MKNFWKDFKAFVSKGNIIDLAVAVVVGGAFGKIVTSLVNDIIMPLISLAIGGADVADWKWVIKKAIYDTNGVLLTAETALKYGAFLQSIIDFVIIAFFIFLSLRILMASRKKIDQFTEVISKTTKKGKDKNKTNITTDENPATYTQSTLETKPVQDKSELKAKEDLATDKETEVDTDTVTILKDIRNLLKQNSKPTKASKPKQ